MFHFLHNYPHFLEALYDLTFRTVSIFKPWLKPGGFREQVFIFWEKIAKGPIFHCQMCGQCVLHSTGMMCPMACPKNLRDGPCGGVRPNGHCEVSPEMCCVWVQAYENAQRMPRYGRELLLIQPPLNWQLKGTSSWINMITGVDQQHPKGWIDVNGHMTSIRSFAIAGLKHSFRAED